MLKRERCPGCHGQASTTLYREPLDSPAITRYLLAHYQQRVARDFSGYDYELARCRHCGLAYQAQVPAPALLEEIYDQWLPATERALVAARWGLDDYRYLAAQVEFMLEHFRLRPGAVKALDFGFGWAEWAKMAGAYGCDVCGAELSEVRIDYARSVGIPVLDASALPQGEYHFINTEQVFEHLLEPGDMLRRLGRSLRPGGVVKVSVPDAAHSLRKLLGARSFAALGEADIMPIAPFEHVNAFTHASLAALGRGAGLALLRPSLRKLYNSSSGWMNPKSALKTLARPVYRHIYPRSTFIYFARPA
ncbi:class I SAM-dependent methyltransferase [Massilia yuzhufengensis]|uniref:Methyltransferase domain-containing protein n=1 Tax=Massilia yuzhufengensis TaxID=1164594 RepID=A0A1I1UK43_9BURK|nr:class I SAM-dependent methyltransferase [Massilia yuzhufengensis]SFD71074.1 Methyltransferase domain-containing protein [Massilia yuzhufengensis]